MWAQDGYDSVYTLPDCGQRKFGGWTEAGLSRFKTLWQNNALARATDHSKVMEKAILDAVRALNEVQFATWEEASGGSRKRKSIRPASAALAVDVDGEED